VDENGKFSYSNVVAVTNNTETLQLQALFPNPSSDKLNLRINAPRRSVYNMKIINVAGQEFPSGPVQFLNGENIITVPVSALKPGLYFLVFQNEFSTQSFRFIKK
jgi:hypothetical protein